MFYRFDGTRQKAIDLDNNFSGSCILVGGGPQIVECAKKLEHPAIMTLVMNNAAVTVHPKLWIGCDRIENYSKSIVLNPTIMKFAQLSRMGCELAGDPTVKWRMIPNTYFFPAKEIPMRTFFQKGKWFGWWKNVFIVSLQLLYRLGFTRVYTVGCGFKTSITSQYGFPSNLNEAQVNYNQRTYKMALGQFKEMLPYARGVNFSVISCTPDSALNDIVPYIEFDTVYDMLVKQVPAHDSVNVRHPKEDESAPAQQ